MTAPFGERLADAVAARGPLCVGIDPHAPLLEKWGLTDDAGRPGPVHRRRGRRPGRHRRRPQAAAGLLRAARLAGAGRPGGRRRRGPGPPAPWCCSTPSAGTSARRWTPTATTCGPTTRCAVDAMTVSPYLGPGSLQPAVDTARLHGGGLFVLARTSNPDAGTFQHALVGERSVAQVVVDTVRGWNTPGWVVGDPLPDIAAVRDLASRFGPTTGSFGVVVGATLRELDVDLDGLGGPILAPGLGCAGRLGRGPAPAVRHRTGRRPHRLPRRARRRARTPPRCGPPPSAGRRSSPADGSAVVRRVVRVRRVAAVVAWSDRQGAVPEPHPVTLRSDLRTITDASPRTSTACERRRHARRPIRAESRVTSGFAGN